LTIGTKKDTASFCSCAQWRTQEFCSGGGGSTNSIEDRGQGSGDGSPLVRGSEGSSNFISYSKLFLIFGILRLFMMTTNLFVTANVKQLRTGGSFRILLPFFQTSWDVGFLNSAIFKSFHNRVEFWHDFGGPSEFRGGFELPSPPNTPPLPLGTPLAVHD